MPHGGAVRLRPRLARSLPALGAALALAALALAGGCRQPGPAGLAPRHVAVLSEDQIAAPLTLAAVDDEVHVVFGSLDTLTLQLVRIDPRRHRHVAETIDAVGIYPADLTWFGVHAYAVSDGRAHVVYLDQQQADALIPKWVSRGAGEEQWWVTTPVFAGTPRALLPQDAGQLLLVTATPDGPSVVALSQVSGSGRHWPEGLGDHPRVVRPLACGGRASFVAAAADGAVRRRRDDGSAQLLVHGVGAWHAACSAGTAYVLWHLPSTSEVLFAPLTDDGLGPTTAVTLAIGTTSVYFLPHGDGFGFVIDEVPAAGRRRIALIHPDERRGQDGYRKSVLVERADPSGFQAVHLDHLLVVVERRSGLRASIYALP